MKQSISFTLNGKSVTIEAHPMQPLLYALRDDADAVGTKYGCGEGECGACTVILNDELVMSCLVPAVQAEGARVETIEGLADANELHAVQQAFLESGGAQCGICTPGMIMAGVHHLRHPERAPGGVPEALEGNLCRCTGYTRIFTAMKRAKEILSANGTAP
ncbi:(2Fe-2S)-binding protein [Candidatus Sumerlaeota bacterium]|nr:(2Fe-2S)-binding protein [Candidatus Sumerlaeota bacterium]HNM45505.1 (2Fe-2S)-binding protein [Candidatus Sumerlaeota bacterium]